MRMRQGRNHVNGSKMQAPAFWPDVSGGGFAVRMGFCPMTNCFFAVLLGWLPSLAVPRKTGPMC